MPRAGGAIGRHVVALDTLLSEHPEPLALRDQVVWLQPPATNGE